MHDVQPRAGPRGLRLDLIVAIVLAAILSIGWSVTDWPRLSRLLLPDPDDMMRLAQVRDWLAGQGINDWTQYRMAPPLGAPMHWSRINDFGIAGIILAATPLIGRHHAELAAVLLYPALLFACAVFLSARIGRRLWGAGGGPVAAVLMALAYPGTTVFIPGRIDHHGLQAVLIQLLVLLLMQRPTARGGVIAGLTASISLVVGLESAPQVVAVIAVLFFGWAAALPGARGRMAGFAAGLAGSTLSFLLFLRPSFWSGAFCDAFTPASAAATLAGSAALGLLVALAPALPNWRWRVGAGVCLGSAALGGTLLAYPSCIHGPYGAVDPFLLTWYIPHIGEAIGVFDQSSPAAMLAFGGMVATGCVVSVWMVARAPMRWPITAPIAATLAISAAVTLVQVRGAYIGAPLAAPVLAGLILAARRAPRWGTAALAGAWLASAGMVYLRVPEEIEARFGSVRASDMPSVQVACTVGDTWSEVDRYPAGIVMAGTNVAGYLIGATHHSTIGAGYHRNNAGNMAMYRFFLGAPDQARAIARQWHVDYVLFCPGDFDEIRVGQTFPGSLAAQLAAGHPPAWLEPLPLHETPLRFYRLR